MWAKSTDRNSGRGLGRSSGPRGRNAKAPRRRSLRKKALALFVAACSSASFWAPWSSAFAQSPSASAPGGVSTIYADELSRLAAISTRLAQLNETLRAELSISKASSSALAASLESSRVELAALRRELEESRTLSTELASRARSSATESTALLEALRKAEDSLTSSERSFEEYRRAAEVRVLKAEASSFLLAALAAAGWILALVACFF